MYFQKHGRKGARRKCRLGKPQRILDAAGQGMDQSGLSDAEVDQSGCIGEACFPYDMSIGDEEQALSCCGFALASHQRHRQAETGHGTRLLKSLAA